MHAIFSEDTQKLGSGIQGVTSCFITQFPLNNTNIDKLFGSYLICMSADYGVVFDMTPPTCLTDKHFSVSVILVQ